jgi:hypothetical protein
MTSAQRFEAWNKWRREKPEIHRSLNGAEFSVVPNSLGMRRLVEHRADIAIMLAAHAQNAEPGTLKQ